jgi:hypothetical protein
LEYEKKCENNQFTLFLISLSINVVLCWLGCCNSRDGFDCGAEGNCGWQFDEW